MIQKIQMNYIIFIMKKRKSRKRDRQEEDQDSRIFLDFNVALFMRFRKSY